jgi:hypothetical protein
VESSVCLAESASQLASFVVDNYRQENHLRVASQGKPGANVENGRREMMVDLSRLNKILEYDQSDLVITLESGLGLRALNQELLERGQFFPVIAGASELSLSDLVAAGDGGALETGFGYLRTKLLGAKLHYKYGREFRLGGKVVKNVTGYDLPKLLVGARGSLGIASSFSLRLWARPQQFTLFFVGGTADRLFRLLGRLFTCGFPLTVAELFSAYDLPDGIEIDTTGKCFLLLGVAGSFEIVENLLIELKASLRDFSVVEYDFAHLGESDSACDLQTRLLLAPPEAPYVELAASSCAARQVFLKMVEKNSQVQLRLRLSCGRLYFKATAVDGWRSIIVSLKEILANFSIASQLGDYENFPVSVQFRDQNENDSYTLLDLGLSDSHNKLLIKQKVREVFDPLACFAPEVNFQLASSDEFFLAQAMVKK